MEQIALKAVLRDGIGKEAAKKLRSTGFVPAIIYHKADKPVVISVNSKDLAKILHTAGSENVLISLTIENDKKAKARAVLVKEVQHHPVKRDVLHVDFNEISLTEKITVDVEIMSDGEPAGVKEGGVLDHPLRELKIQCLPTDIPKNITVDVSGLKVNDSIHVRDLNLGDKIKVLTDPDVLLFQVKIREEKAEDETVAPPEVEVMREKKEEEPKAGAAKEEPKKEAAKEKK